MNDFIPGFFCLLAAVFIFFFECIFNCKMEDQRSLYRIIVFFLSFVDIFLIFNPLKICFDFVLGVSVFPFPLSIFSCIFLFLSSLVLILSGIFHSLCSI